MITNIDEDVFNVLPITQESENTTAESDNGKAEITISSTGSSLSNILEQTVDSGTESINLPQDEDSESTNRDMRSNNTKTSLKVIYTNADSYLNKRNELSALIEKEKPDVICMAEIFPKNKKYSYNACEYKINGYTAYINDKGHRGVAIYIHEKLNSYSLSLPSSNFEELVICCVEMKTFKLVIATVYRSPSGTEENNQNLNNILEELEIISLGQLLVVGDFNYRNIDWTQHTPKAGNNTEKKFMDQINLNNWCQHVKDETRFREGQEPSLLDLIFTSNVHSIDEVRIESPIGKSDHAVLITEYIGDKKYIKTVPKLNFYKGNYSGMREYLSKEKWPAAMEQQADMMEKWEELYSNLKKATSLYVPNQKISSNMHRTTYEHNTVTATSLYVPNQKISSNMHRTTYEHNTVTAIKNKHTLWNKFQKNRTDENWNKYKEGRNLATKAIRLDRRNKEKLIASNIKKNPKAFWNFVRGKTAVKTGITDLKTSDGLVLTKDEDKAGELNRFFASVFTKEDLNNVPNLEVIGEVEKLDNFDISETEVDNLLKSIKTDKSPGPDLIHNRVLHETKDIIKVPLTNLFNKSLETGVIPDIWKTANVTPIYKKGCKSDPNNYQPVSLTSTVCKLLEKLVRNKIELHMQEHHLWTDCQHGFRSGRSCCTQLLGVIDDWSRGLDEGLSTDVIYLDYRKAFDSVPHQRLLVKLKAYGIDGNILKWIENFLTGRSQKVVINGECSDKAEVTSGIPQGSVLGPLLFLVYVNDLPRGLNCTAALFADDTKLYKIIRSDVDRAALQNDLNQVAI